MSSRSATLGHVFACCDALYRSLGEGAATLGADAYVVRLHEMARTFGALALDLRGHLDAPPPPPLAIIERVLTRAIATDPTGTLAVYAMAVVVGPRLLVTLRDVRVAHADDQEFQSLLDEVARVTLAEIQSLARVGEHGADTDDPRWRASARELVNLLDASGNAESFVLSR